jgi:pantetheine-phosphate adenylyltransferase
MTKACYPGSFDPVTNGHLDVVRRASALFDEVVVAVLENQSKRGLFTVDERVEMLRRATAEMDGVKVGTFHGLVVEFCKQVGADVIVKGLRAVSDFDYEMQMAQMNKRMGIESAFLAAKPEYTYLSSSLMREVVALGGNIDGLVPDFVIDLLREKFKS